MNEVVILNYSDLEQVNTQLIVLKGYFKNVENLDEINIKLCSNNSYLTIDSSCIKIIKMSFSIIIQLNSGQNLIIFEKNGIEIKRLILQLKIVNDQVCIVKPLVFSKSKNTELINMKYLDTVNVGIEIVQWYFSEKLFENKYKRSSFIFSKPIIYQCEEIYDENFQNLTLTEIWRKIGTQLQLDPVWNKNYKFLVFLEQVSIGPKVQRSGHTESKCALAGGNLAVFHHEILYNLVAENIEEIFPNLENTLEIKTENRIGNLLPTVGRQFDGALGTLAHELGHLFDLGHSETGIMGKDFLRFSLSLYPKIRSILGFETRKIYVNPNQIINDPVQFNPSSLCILNYNWYFQRNISIEALANLEQITLSQNTVKSTVELSVIEIRDLENEEILASWKKNSCCKKVFQITRRFINSSQNQSKNAFILFAQNTFGATMKCIYNASDLIEGFSLL